MHLDANQTPPEHLEKGRWIDMTRRPSYESRC